MKIVAQSTASSGMPYLHLGYVSATQTFDRTSGPLSLGLLSLGLLLVGALLSSELRRGVDAPTSGLLSSFGPRKWTPRRLIGATLMAFALVGVAISILIGGGYLYPGGHTWSVLHQVASRLSDSERPEADNPLPTRGFRTIEEVCRHFGLRDEYTQDGWHRPLRVRQVQEASGVEYVVSSAGADGEFGTADDMEASTAPLEGEEGVAPDSKAQPTGEAQSTGERQTTGETSQPGEA
jgi:hypothetical protein